MNKIIFLKISLLICNKICINHFNFFFISFSIFKKTQYYRSLSAKRRKNQLLNKFVMKIRNTFI